MTEGKDIVALSIPFSIGVALVAFVPSVFGSSLTMAGLYCLLAVMSAGIFCFKGAKTLAGMLMFFFAGLMCCSISLLSISKEAVAESIPERALFSLIRVIDGCGFAYDQTGALVKALITGNRQGLDRATTAVFRDSGAAHILALSGLHMGVIYGILNKSLFWIGKSRTSSVIKFGITMSASAFFTIMAGCGASVVRAFLFISINEISKLFPGRRRRPLAVLCAAMMIQLIFNPLIIKSISFQLSYLAMLAIYTLFPIMQSWYPESQGRDPLRKIWTAAALSISCQLYTAPLAWIYFHTFPTNFLIANLVAIPISEMLILSSVITIVAEALGICPKILKSLTDLLAQALVKSLEIITTT